MTVLLGSTGVGTDGNDFEPAGGQIGAKKVASATGVIDTITVRTHSGNLATSLQAAIFADSAGVPSTKIGNTVLISPITASTLGWWTSAPGANAAVVSGTTYWIIFLSPTGGGQFQYRLFDSTTANGTKDDSTAGLNIKSPWTAGGSFTELMNSYAEDSGIPVGSRGRSPIQEMLASRGYRRALGLRRARPTRGPTGVSCRRFNGIGSFLDFPLSPLIGTDATYATLVRTRPRALLAGLVTQNTATDGIMGGLLANETGPGGLSYINHSNSTDALTQKFREDWAIVVVTKTAGTTKPRFHRWIESGGGWVHEDGVGTIANPTLGTPGKITIGSFQKTSSPNRFFDGDVAVAGVWNVALTDLEVEGLSLNRASQDWKNTQSSGLQLLVDLNQPGVTTVPDLSGNARDQSAEAQTAINDDGPASWTFGVAGGTQHPSTLAGTLTFSGAFERDVSRALAAVLSFTGAQAKRTARALAAVLTFGGALTKGTGRALTGALSFAGALLRVHLVIQLLTGALSFTGTMTKRTGRALASTLAFAGALIKLATRALVAVLTFTGATAKRLARALLAVLTFTGALARQLQFNRALSAVLTFTGADAFLTSRALTATLSFVGTTSKRTARALAAVLSFTGATAKRIPQLLTGTLTFAGTLLKGGVFGRLLTGTLTFTGSLVTGSVFGRSISGTLTFAGAQTRRTARALTAALSFTGTLLKRTGRALSAVLTFTGSLAKRVPKVLTATLSFAGSLLTGLALTRALTATLSFTGNLAKNLALTRALSATLTFTGAATRRTGKALSGVLSFTGATVKRTPMLLTGTLTFAGTTAKRIPKILTGTLTSTGSLLSGLALTRALTASLSFAGTLAAGSVFGRALAGTLTFSGTQIRRTGKALTAAATFTGTLARRTARALVAALAFAGTTAKRTGRALNAVLTASGVRAAGHIFGKALSAVVAFVGSLLKGRGKNLPATLTFTGTLTTFFTSGVTFEPPRFEGSESALGGGGGQGAGSSEGGQVGVATLEGGQAGGGPWEGTGGALGGDSEAGD
jgi:hypothetical protein